MKILSSEVIEKHIQMSGMVDEMAKAYLILRDNKSVMPVRTITDFGEGNPLMFFKPACDNTNGQVAVKLLNQLKQTSKEGYPTIQGLVLLLDGQKNEILSIMDGRIITAMRTGAASGLATRWLAREDARVLVVFGAGAQAYTQIKAVLAVRNIRKIIVFDLYEKAIDKLISYFGYLKDVEFVKGKSLAMLGEADVICTVTNSSKPLFETKYLKEGVHINAIGSFARGMREMPDNVYEDSFLFVDHYDSCFSESGDVIFPKEKGYINENNYKGEIADLLSGKVPGRDSTTRRTIFKSVGVATQDLVAAQYIYSKAVEEGFGLDVNF